MPENVPVLISSCTIKDLLEIDKTDEQGRLPLCTLLYDISKDEDLFTCPPSSSVASFFLLCSLFSIPSKSSSEAFDTRPCMLLKVGISLLSQIDGSPFWEILAKKAVRQAHRAVHCLRV